MTIQVKQLATLINSVPDGGERLTAIVHITPDLPLITKALVNIRDEKGNIIFRLSVKDKAAADRWIDSRYPNMTRKYIYHTYTND